MKHIQLSEHFTVRKILLFALPSIGMQLVDNTYQVADGYFISNYISEAAFEAENLIFPPLLVVIGCFLWWKRKTADGYLPEPSAPEDL